MNPRPHQERTLDYATPLPRRRDDWKAMGLMAGTLWGMLLAGGVLLLAFLFFLRMLRGAAL